MGDHYNHYTNSGGSGERLWERIESALRANGLDPNDLTPEDIAPVDQFHSRGRFATLEMVEMLESSGITPDMRVLDIGGGLGGSARILASQIGCSVEVLDLTEGFCNVGRELSKRTGLSNLVHFTHGNALDIPFPDDGFDAVWTQHSTMNIADKPKLYAEMKRILKPGGILIMHEVFAASGNIHFPVPWAKNPSMSHLVTQDESRNIISRAGFDEIAWTDETEESTRWFAKRTNQAKNISQTDTPTLGLQLILGNSFGEMILNQTRNLTEGKISVARGVFEAITLY